MAESFRIQGGFERKPTSSGSVNEWSVAEWQAYNREQAAAAASDESIGAEPAGEATADERPTLHVLLSYDYHNVFDMHWPDTRDFRDRIFREKPPWVAIQELVLSFSSDRARESQATLRREIPDIEFVRFRNPVGRQGKGAIWISWERRRNHTCHVDDRSDIVEDVRGARLTAHHLDYRNVWLSELASDIITWLWSLWLRVHRSTAMRGTNPNPTTS